MIDVSVSLILHDTTRGTISKALANIANVEAPRSDGSGYCFSSNLTVYESLWVPLSMSLMTIKQ